MELIDLQKKVQDYVNSGFAHDVVQAARQAQEATRLFIKRTHPATGFDGQNLTNMIVKGAFKVEGTGKVVANVYANYFARWYNTGALGRIILRGPRKGQKGPTYAARGPILIRMLTPLGNITWIISLTTLSDGLTFRR